MGRVLEAQGEQWVKVYNPRLLMVDPLFLYSLAPTRSLAKQSPTKMKHSEVTYTASSTQSTISLQSSCRVKYDGVELVNSTKCEPEVPIITSSCTGKCSSSTHLDVFRNKLISTCKCCRPVEFRKQSAKLVCKNQTELDYEYLKITKCECKLCDFVPKGFTLA